MTTTLGGGTQGGPHCSVRPCEVHGARAHSGEQAPSWCGDRLHSKPSTAGGSGCALLAVTLIDLRRLRQTTEV